MESLPEGVCACACARVCACKWKGTSSVMFTAHFAVHRVFSSRTCTHTHTHTHTCAEAVYIGPAAMTLEEIRKHNALQPTIYKLNVNDCRCVCVTVCVCVCV